MAIPAQPEDEHRADSTPPPSRTVVQLTDQTSIRRSALVCTAVRARGPGGQNVNKVNSAILLRVAIADLEGLDVAARERLRRLAGRRLTDRDEIMMRSGAQRSQIANRRACIARLGRLVAEAEVVPKTRKKKKPTRAMIRRRLESKRKQAEKKERRRGKRPRTDD